ncbi:Chaperone protein [Caenispirillum salinarum AK4]|uniref:Chaperone protein n=1 Tax=Caenispirillum salinarum AK4 TaxID=1238182 RepID=K9GWZ5_9PROT|nr:ATP12 family protein [Caenispirillum salinarum]EKV29274.1 Chaperone protein [Caenispirillum salinarum AK4]
MSSLVNRPMKRFYKTAEAVPAEGGLHAVHLDGRPVRTPSKAALAVPFPALAEAIAAEWNEQGETLVLDNMPLTQLANSAIDRVAPLRDTMIEEVLRFAETELLCYRVAEAEDAALAARQASTWQPLLDWARQRYDAALCHTAGLMPVDQPPEALRALRAAVADLDDWRLTALQAAAAPLGSLVLALALLEGRLDAEAAYRAAYLDELFQMEHWGADAEAQARLERQRKDIADAARFLALLGS